MVQKPEYKSCTVGWPFPITLLPRAPPGPVRGPLGFHHTYAGTSRQKCLIFTEWHHIHTFCFFKIFSAASDITG